MYVYITSIIICTAEKINFTNTSSPRGALDIPYLLYHDAVAQLNTLIPNRCFTNISAV